MSNELTKLKFQRG